MGSRERSLTAFCIIDGVLLEGFLQAVYDYVYSSEGDEGSKDDWRQICRYRDSSGMTPFRKRLRRALVRLRSRIAIWYYLAVLAQLVFQRVFAGSFTAKSMTTQQETLGTVQPPRN